MSVHSHTPLCCAVFLNTPSFDLFLSLTSSGYNSSSVFNLISPAISLSPHLPFLPVKSSSFLSLCRACPYLNFHPLLSYHACCPHLYYHVCLFAIYSVPFISLCSALLCVFYLSLSCLSTLAHLPSYNPCCLWLLSKFPHFLSLCLVLSLSFLSLFPSCLPLRQPEYENVISHSSASPPSPLFAASPSVFLSCLYLLLTLLPSMSPCLVCPKLFTHSCIL